ncbi:MAG: hypothetical protein ACE15B_02390 [Bryobacteraceae bacterium]
MNRVDEIEDAIDRLPPNKFRQFARWVHERKQQQCDQLLARDSDSGKLDFLFAEAEEEANAELLRDWPAAK